MFKRLSAKLIACALVTILAMAPVTVVTAFASTPPDVWFLHHHPDVFVSNEYELMDAIQSSMHWYPHPLLVGLSNDIELTSGLALTVGPYQNVAIVGNNGSMYSYAISAAGHHYGPIFYVYGGGRLTLGSVFVSNVCGNPSSNIHVENGYLTLANWPVIENAQNYGIYLYNSELNMDGAMIRSNHGGGVFFQDSTFNMFSGSIINNAGAGVTGAGGTFNMHHGWIRGQTSGSYFGVLLRGNTAFNMHGGTIDYFGTGVRLDLGLPLYPNTEPATFDMWGGSIRSNAAGVSTNTDTVFRMMGGAVENNHGHSGVVVYNSRFYMHGGVIRNNSSHSSGPFLRGGGVSVLNTSPNWGAPVSSTFTMYNGIIENNTASGSTVHCGQGGGVLIGSAYSSFIMKGGVIRGNTATSYGGGVGMPATHGGAQLFAMYGGIIENNTAARAGGGMQLANTHISADTGNRIINGIIRNNTAGQLDGGGIFSRRGNLYIRDSIIANNQSGNGGAGIKAFWGTVEITNSIFENNTVTSRIPPYVNPHPVHGSGGGILITSETDLIMHSGRISGNTAYNDGGGIWAFDLSRITVGADVVFSNNQARRAFNRLPEDDALYYANIHATQWTAPFTQGFNNYDISYTQGTPFTQGMIFDLTVGNIEGVVDQSAATITFNIMNTALDNGRFVGVVDRFVADDAIALFYVNGQEWPIQQGQLAGFSSGDKVYVAGGVAYTLIIVPVQGRISSITVGGIEGVINQDAATITFSVMASQLTNGRFVGALDVFDADCNVALFYVYGNAWPIHVGQPAGFSSGDKVFVADGVVYTIHIMPF